ncbi:MAG: hypothetical protein ABWZ56_02205 [Flavobacterium sp.]
MFKLIHFLLLIFILCSSVVFSKEINPYDPIAEQIMVELMQETQQVKLEYKQRNFGLQNELVVVIKKLNSSRTIQEQVQLLVRKENLQQELIINYKLEQADISKIRYIKGLEIIKLLYDKVLALDHHFATITTFNEINKIANPNSYPEFAKMKEVLVQKKDAKTGFNMSNLMNSNVYTSVIYSFVSLFTNENTTKTQKEDSLKEVECILDFTLRMQNDLNTIYFETAFLQKSNEGIKSDLERLFVDYTKALKYNASLAACRNNDDWDTIKESLNQYLVTLNKTLKDESQMAKAQKMQVNLEFPIDRLLQFITQYNSFIDQGSKFYQKFHIMLNSYENQKQCESKIPLEYLKMKDGIVVAIDKFNTAYKPLEINGSKMKEILYGVNEYE